MVQLIVYTIYALMRCGIVIISVLTLFSGVLGVFLGAFVMLGAIVEYFLFLTMIQKISNLEKKENSQN